MFYSELYGAYYNAVAAFLREMIEYQETDPDGSISEKKIREILGKSVSQYAFLESYGLQELARNFLVEDEKAEKKLFIRNKPTMPLTKLQKQWLNTLSQDPRLKLFSDKLFDYPDVEPLFNREDCYVYDRYQDGDDFEDPGYIERFRTILKAVRTGKTLEIESLNRRGEAFRSIIYPEYLEYSEKDDKFRVVGSGSNGIQVINLGRIQKCSLSTETIESSDPEEENETECYIEFDLKDDNKALDRVLHHFAHYRKRAEKENENYHITIYYDPKDETEIVIRVLSFGPRLTVTGPENFVEKIRLRLIRQRELWRNRNITIER